MISFYQESKCWVMDRSRILNPKFELNRHIALFLIPQLNKYNKVFTYSKSANPKDIAKLSLLLPIDEKEQPDWKFMNNYVQKREKELGEKIGFLKINTNQKN